MVGVGGEGGGGSCAPQRHSELQAQAVGAHSSSISATKVALALTNVAWPRRKGKQFREQLASLSSLVYAFQHRPLFPPPSPTNVLGSAYVKPGLCLGLHLPVRPEPSFSSCGMPGLFSAPDAPSAKRVYAPFSVDLEERA